MSHTWSGWHSTRIAPEQRALGLAYVSALRPRFDPDAAAHQIVAVVGRQAIATALDGLRRSRRAWPSDASIGAEEALRRALEIAGRSHDLPVAS